MTDRCLRCGYSTDVQWQALQEPFLICEACAQVEQMEAFQLGRVLPYSDWWVIAH